MGNPRGDKDEQRALHRGSFDGSRRMDGVTAGALWVFLPVVPAGFLFGGKLRDVVVKFDGENRARIHNIHR